MGLYHTGPMSWTESRALLALGRALARRFRQDRVVQAAGSLTFTTLLALVPLLTVALAVTSAFPVFDQLTGTFERYVVEHFLPDGGAARISKQLSGFAKQAGRLTALGIAILAVTALMLMLTVDEVLNRLFHVSRRRPLLQRLIVYWAVLSLGPVLIGAGLTMTSFLVGGSLGMLDLGGYTRTVLGLLPFAITCAALTLLYLVVPCRRIELRHAVVGGVVAGVLFELAKRGFALYIAKFPTYTLIYGAFATLPIFLVWLYLSWLVVLLGAQLTAMLPGFRSEFAAYGDAPGLDLLDALAVLRRLALAQRAGGTLTASRIACETGLPPHRCEAVLERCAALGWAARSDREIWLLARDAGAIRVADVVRAFAIDPVALRALSPPALAEHFERAGETLTMTLQDLAAEEQPA